MSDESKPVPHDDPDLVTVFATSQVDVGPVIKSILDGADIPYVTGGDALMELFPSDFLGTHRRPRELTFKVPADRAEEAKALLTEVGDADPGDGADPQAP
ncbi:MAG: hypothetical protein AAGN66_22825 [Acidobacteriota bacterium]